MAECEWEGEEHLFYQVWGPFSPFTKDVGKERTKTWSHTQFTATTRYHYTPTR